MNNKALTLSVLMAIVAVFFVQSYVSSIEDETKKKFGAEVVVFVAKKDIKEMDTLREELIEPRVVPKRFLEPAAVASDRKEPDEKDTARITKQLAGTIAIVPIRKGEQLTYNKLTEAGMRTGLSPQVSPGRRAVAVPVSDITGVAKLVKPGDRVDLIALIDMGGGKDNKVAKTVLQDVVVLAAGRNVANNVARVVENDPFGGPSRVRSLTEDSSFGTVTLEVEPAQAQVLALLMGSGDNALTLTLRNNDDTERVGMQSVTLGEVLGTDINKLRAPAGKR